MKLSERMEFYGVPGVSIAVINGGQIAWAKGYGVAEMGTSSPVTPQTMFQAGSVSKPVAAAGALFLVQEGQLSLDENINNKLKSWKLPENELTREQKVTLRRLLSHTAGLTVHFVRLRREVVQAGQATSGSDQDPVLGARLGGAVTLVLGRDLTAGLEARWDTARPFLFGVRERVDGVRLGLRVAQGF